MGVRALHLFYLRTVLLEVLDGLVARLDVVFEESAEDFLGYGAVGIFLCHLDHAFSYSGSYDLHIDACLVEEDELVIECVGLVVLCFELVF